MATKSVDKAAKKNTAKAKAAPTRKPAGKEATSARRPQPTTRSAAKPSVKATPGKAAAKPLPTTKSKAKPAATAAKSVVKSAAPKGAKSSATKSVATKPTKPVATTKAKPAPAARQAATTAAPKSKTVTPKTKDAAKPVGKGAKADAVAKSTAPVKPAAESKSKAAVAAKKPEASKLAAPADKKIAEAATKKTSKAPAGAKTAPHSPAMKKPLVGQKPRTERPASANDGIPLSFMPKAPDPVTQPPVKSSPASQEAKLDFKVDDHVVYPAHGVGRIVGIERQVIAGIVNELFLIDFEQEKMKLRVPTAKAKAVGMRQLSDATVVKKAIETLKGRARIKRTMWSRRAQEYEAKINSGDILSVAEVVRDLYRASDQPEQSYSERQLFEAALDRLAREVAAVHKSDLAAAIAELEGALQQKKAA